MLNDEKGGGRELQVVLLHELGRRSGVEIVPVSQTDGGGGEP